jgi:hypothetical protein
VQSGIGMPVSSDSVFRRPNALKHLPQIDRRTISQMVEIFIEPPASRITADLEEMIDEFPFSIKL